MSELKDLKDTFTYIKENTVLKDLLNTFSIVVSCEDDTYILKNEKSDNKFWVEVSSIEEDSLYYYYKIKCHDDKVGSRIDDGRCSIRKKATGAPSADEILKEVFLKVYYSIGRKYD